MHGLALAGAALAAGVSFFASPVAADVDPIVVKGNHFFYKTNGTEFYIKGVAYQQNAGGNGSAAASGGSATSLSDPLADNAGCDRDVPLLQQLQTNTIRVYDVDPTANHSHCMSMLQDAGIYLIADLGSPTMSINQDSPEWNVDLYKRYTSVIDALGNYTNVIGFFAGNEVANQANNTASLAFVRAAVRDMKSYVSSMSRPIYIGYASSDNDGIRTDIESYLNCGPQTSDNIDFFGYNIYSWCDPSTYQTSGYEARTQELANYSIPAFFAEYGCNTGQTRDFQETGALFGSEMTGVWSGGIVYEYFQEANNYGLVSIDGSSASTLPPFGALKTAIASVSPTVLNSASFTPTNTALRSCPAVGDDWQASPTIAPAVNEGLCDCMVSSLSCVTKGNVSSDSAGELFGYICGGKAGVNCDGISGDGTTGTYGAYSMCDTQARLAWAFNAYYSAQSSSNKAQACDFAGNATEQSPSAASSCKPLIQAAGGVQGTSTPPPGTNAPSASSSKKSAAGMVTVPELDFGVVKMGLYVAVAALTGAGVVLM